jgi:signal transduction histidine kinase
MDDTLRTSWWRTLTLPGQFLLAGGAVMVAAGLVVGTFVAKRIEQVVVQNSGITAALYMENFISPLSQDLATSDTLSPPAAQALTEIFQGTALGDRVVSYKIWKPGGRVVHASDPAQVGQVFPEEEHLAAAFAGQISASFESLEGAESQAEAALGIPLLEVYSPIRELWTGEVIAVAEFYERAEKLRADLADARRTSWMIVGGVFLMSGALLLGIVQAGGRTIVAQSAALSRQLEESREMAAANLALRDRVVAASSRATSLMERAVRRIGSDLHDGPAQYLALAALKLDTAIPDGPRAADLRQSIDSALTELRAISRGLALPDLDRLDLAAILDRALTEHARQSGAEVARPDAPDIQLDYARKLCVYRFLQEALSNAHRHAGAAEVRVDTRTVGTSLVVTVADDGVGFDPAADQPLRPDGGQGLLGLSDRAESLGGRVDVDSRPGAGTRLTLNLPLEDLHR